MAKTNFKVPHQPNKGKKISVDGEQPLQPQHPIFCFKYLDKEYHLEKCDQKEEENFID